MQKANISDLKNKLSSYLRKVRSGETILVMDRGVPIARIERVARVSDDERLAKLEAAGLLRRPTKPLPLKMLREELPTARASVVQALLEERERGR